MAWTKAKTATVIGAGVLLAVGTSTVVINTIHSARVARYPDLQGAWEAVVPVRNGDAHLVWKVEKTNGSYHSMFDSVTTGQKDFSVDQFEYDYPVVRFRVGTVNPLVFRGTLSSEATELPGTLQIGNQNAFPLTLRRTANPAAAPEPLKESEFAPRSGSDIQGYWVSTTNGAAPAGARIKVAESAEGNLRAEMDIPSQAVKALPITSVAYHPPAVELTISDFSGFGGRFRGTLKPGGNLIAGTWTPGDGKPLPMTLIRADYQAELRQEQALEAQRNYSPTSPDDFAGYWRGVLTEHQSRKYLALKMARTADGTPFAAIKLLMDQNGSPYPGATYLAATEVRYSPPNVTLRWEDNGRWFQGKINGDKLSGMMHQGKDSSSVVFKRSAAD